MLLSVERPFVGAFAVHIPRATLLLRNGLVQAVLPASTRTCANGQSGFPRNLGDPVVSSATSRLELPGDQLQASAAHSSAGSERNECTRGTAKRRQRSAAGWAAGSQSVLIVPMKLANSTQPEPVEGSETSDHGTVIEKHDECIEIRQTCPRNRNG